MNDAYVRGDRCYIIYKSNQKYQLQKKTIYPHQSFCLSPLSAVAAAGATRPSLKVTVAVLVGVLVAFVLRPFVLNCTVVVLLVVVIFRVGDNAVVVVAVVLLTDVVLTMMVDRVDCLTVVVRVARHWE